MRGKPKVTRILVIHGPNLNLLGRREPAVYGKVSLEQINNSLKDQAAKSKARVLTRQSNVEGRIVDWIQAAENKFDGILINPAAYTHTSVAIRDALAALDIPVVEVHLSNIYSREEFRHKSLISPVTKGTVMGFGARSYNLALSAILDLIKTE